MIALYVNGTRIGTLADAESLIPRFLAARHTVVLRDEVSGKTLGTCAPEAICPWEPGITSSDLSQRIEQGGMPLAEFWQQKGVS